MMRDKPLVLIVDDEKSLLLIAQRVLQKEGFEVITASNGLEGLKQAQEKLPDVILLDIVMPELKRVRGLPRVAEFPGHLRHPGYFLSVKGVIDENIDVSVQGLKEINEAFAYGAADFLK